MRVKLLYFGVLKDVVGRECEEQELAEGSSVEALLTVLAEGVGSPVWRMLAVAVNREYARPETMLHDGDEVALLPPVSGGCDAR